MAWRGRIDVLVNNAGIYEAADPEGGFEAWEASWNRTLAVCLVSPAALCRAAIASFREHGGGIIVNLASRAAWRGEDAAFWHYAAAKAGVVAMTKTIARQYGRQGVTAFAVAPGFVDTAFNAPAVAEHGMQLFLDDTAPRRGGPAAGRGQRDRLPRLGPGPPRHRHHRRREQRELRALSAQRRMRRPWYFSSACRRFRTTRNAPAARTT